MSASASKWWFSILLSSITVFLLLPCLGNSSSVVPKCELGNFESNLKSSNRSSGNVKSASTCSFASNKTMFVLSVVKKVATGRKCKLWKTYWRCQEPYDEKILVEFAEDYPDWKKEYWRWRSKYVSLMTLTVNLETERSLRFDVSFPDNLTEDNNNLQNFTELFLRDLENSFCFYSYRTQPHSDISSRPNTSSVGKGSELPMSSLSCSYVGGQTKQAIQDVYIGLLFVASVFLLLTCIIQVIIWDNQTLNGWAIFSEVLSNFFMILTVGLSHYFVRDIDIGPASGGCIALGTAIISHFFFLSTFHWMTVINYNLWRTFRQIRNPANRNNNKLVTYCFYSIFAIGVPMVIVALCFIVDVLPSRPSNNEVEGVNKTTNSFHKVFIRPQYGKKFCYMSKEAQGHYIYYPIGTLIVTNVILFGLAAFSLMKHRAETKVLQGNRNVSTRVKVDGAGCTGAQGQGGGPTQSIFLFAKLFCIMGVSWVFEVFAWAFSRSGENVPLYWIIFDVTNLIQAIAVFIMFVCKRDVLIKVKEKFIGKQ